tara:strand:- start:1579 stop:3198 length:1620 start_codon:yes stop_codon:yes gene_type:complete
MPILYNDSLDDQIAYDACQSFTGGQVSNVRSNLLSPIQYSKGVNVDIDRFGSIVTRRGLTTDDYGGLYTWGEYDTNWGSSTDSWGSVATPKIDSIFYFDTPLIEQLVAVSDEKVHKNTGTTSWDEVSGWTPTSDRNVEAAQLVDKLYMTDGVANVRSYDGSSFTDEGTGTDNPPICKYLVTHTNRLFAAGCSVPDALYCSDLLDGSTWDIVNNQIRIGGDSGDPITAIHPWIGVNLVVFKERSIFNVVADPQATNASSWKIENIDTRMGCVSQRSVAQVGQDLFFLAPDGIRTVRSILEGNAQAISEPISVGIQDVIDEINWNAARDQACAVSWRNHYILSVPTKSSTTNNVCIVYNTVAKAFVGTWTWDSTQFTVSAFNGDLQLIQGTESGQVFAYQDDTQPANQVLSTYQDAGEDYESFVITRGMSFGEQFSELLPNHVEVELKPAIADKVNVRAIIDDGSDLVVNQNPIDTLTSTLTLPFDLPATFEKTVPIKESYNMMQNGPCRELQFKVITNSGKMHLRGIRSSSFVNTINQET